MPAWPAFIMNKKVPAADGYGRDLYHGIGNTKQCRYYIRQDIIIRLLLSRSHLPKAPRMLPWCFLPELY
jgi:hypothetical protein